jgi:hypothetical protein
MATNEIRFPPAATASLPARGCGRDCPREPPSGLAVLRDSRARYARTADGRLVSGRQKRRVDRYRVVVPAEVMRVKDSLDVSQRVPCNGCDLGHLATRFSQARNGRAAYIVEGKVVRYVRFRARLAPARAEAILGPRRIVRGGGDYGRHARSPVERGLERSADQNLDPSPHPLRVRR